MTSLSSGASLRAPPYHTQHPPLTNATQKVWVYTHRNNFHTAWKVSTDSYLLVMLTGGDEMPGSSQVPVTRRIDSGWLINAFGAFSVPSSMTWKGSTSRLPFRQVEVEMGCGIVWRKGIFTRPVPSTWQTLRESKFLIPIVRQIGCVEGRLTSSTSL